MAKIHYILFYLDCGIYVGYYDFWDLMWDKCGIVCQIIVCRKISTKMWDRCGIWEKVELRQIARNSLCGMNVGLVCVLPCWRCGVDVGFSLIPIIFINFSAFFLLRFDLWVCCLPVCYCYTFLRLNRCECVCVCVCVYIY